MHLCHAVANKAISLCTGLWLAPALDWTANGLLAWHACGCNDVESADGCTDVALFISPLRCEWSERFISITQLHWKEQWDHLESACFPREIQINSVFMKTLTFISTFTPRISTERVTPAQHVTDNDRHFITQLSRFVQLYFPYHYCTAIPVKGIAAYIWSAFRSHGKISQASSIMYHAHITSPLREAPRPCACAKGY